MFISLRKLFLAKWFITFLLCVHQMSHLSWFHFVHCLNLSKSSQLFLSLFEIHFAIFFFIYSVIIEEKWVFTANLLQLNFIISHYWRFVSSNTDAFGSPVQNITLHLCIVSIKICTKEKQMFALGPFLFLLFLCNMRYFLTLFWSYLVFCFNFVSEQRAILLITGLGTCTTPLHK